MRPFARTILFACLIVSSLLGGTGCSGLLNAAATTNVRRDVCVGSSRAAVLRRLGPPLRTYHFDPPMVGSAFLNPPVTAGKDKVASCDDYRVSALLVTSSNDDSEKWAEAYPLSMLATGCLIEILWFPITVVDLGARAVRHDYLRLWYDPAGQLLGESRSSQPLPPPTGR